MNILLNFMIRMFLSCVLYWWYPMLAIRSGTKAAFSIALLVCSLLYLIKDFAFQKQEMTPVSIGIAAGAGVCFLLSTILLESTMTMNYLTPEMSLTVSSIVFLLVSFGMDVYYNGTKHQLEYIGCAIILIGMIVMLIGQKLNSDIALP